MNSPPKLTEVLPPRLPVFNLLSAIVASSEDAIISKSLDGTVTSWNPAAERMFGYAAAELIGDSIFRLIPPDLQSEERENLEKLKNGQQIERRKTRRLRKDGKTVFASLALSAIRDEQGAFVGALELIRDITVESSTNSAQSRLAAIVDSSDEAIISKTLDGTITGWNRAASRIFGYDAEEIVGKSILTLIPADLHSSEAILLERLRRGERIEPYETVRLARDGRRVAVSLTLSPIVDSAGKWVGVSTLARDISEQQNADLALRRLAAIVDSSDDAIVGKDLNGIVQSWNAGAERIFGYTAEEMIGKPITLLMRPQEAQEEPRILSQIAKGERIDHYETIRRRKNGELIDVSLTISAIRNNKGEVIGASKIARDVTRQRRLERERLELLEKERIARSDAEALVESAKALSADLNLANAAQAATDIATQLTGAKFGAFFYNNIDDRQESYMLYALSGAPREAFEKFGMPRNTPIFAPTFRGEKVVRLADVMSDPRYGQNPPHAGMPKGHLPVRSYLAVPVVSRTGEVIGGMFFGHPEIGVFDERAERIAVGIAAQSAVAVDNARLYERLKLSIDRLNFSLAALDLGDWTWDPQSDLMVLSPRAAEMYGFPAGVAGKREELRARIHPEDREKARAVAAEAMLTKSDYFIEYRIQHPVNGERWILAKGRPQLDETGRVTGMMGVVQDITDRKQSEAQIQRHAEILEAHVAERTARLKETIGELEAFSYTVSHDMRQPLRAMSGYADILLREHSSTLAEDAKHFLQRIRHNAGRLELLVRDVLTYSRVSKAEIRLVPLKTETFLEALLPTVPGLQNTSVKLTLRRPLPDVMAHEAYLSQVFTNLIGNAIKFSAKERETRIEILGSRTDDRVQIQVCDNGIGIAPEHFDRIFQIFGRVYPEEKYEGTGIGLSIVRKAVQRMGGNITVQSKLGEGSCFIVELKAATQNTPGAASEM